MGKRQSPAVRFNLRLHQEHKDLLTEAVEEQLAAAKEWKRARRAEIAARVKVEHLDKEQRDQLVDAMYEEFERLRETGQVRDSLSRFVEPHLHDVMAERGWFGRRWKPVGETSRGRPWGTHDAGYAAQAELKISADIGETLLRACYNTSKQATAELRAWYGRHGDHWRGVLHSDDSYTYVGAGPSHADLQERERLIAQVVTTGRVLREAVDRALRSAGKVPILPS
jgi:hypothetical protein